MNLFRWNNDKNEWLKTHRGVCFEQVVLLMERGDILDVIEHPNQDEYPGQRIAVVMIDDYAYLVPYVYEGDEIFLKNSYRAERQQINTRGKRYEKKYIR